MRVRSAFGATFGPTFGEVKFAFLGCSVGRSVDLRWTFGHKRGRNLATFGGAFGRVFRSAFGGAFGATFGRAFREGVPVDVRRAIRSRSVRVSGGVFRSAFGRGFGEVFRTAFGSALGRVL